MKLTKDIFEKNKSGLDGFLEKADIFIFDDILCSILKKLKFNYEIEGAYSKKILLISLKDNIDMIKSHNLNESDAKLYFYMCYPAIAFITRLIDISKEIKEKYDIKPWHESLIKKTYFDLCFGKDYSYTNSEAEISLEDKRPYGNSSIKYDIGHEYFKYNKNKELFCEGVTFNWSNDTDIKWHWVEENYDFLFNIMDETNNIIQLLLKEESYNNYITKKKKDYKHSSHYTNNWYIDYTKKIRNDKINKIIEKQN